jgi:hypothetical protein
VEKTPIYIFSTFGSKINEFERKKSEKKIITFTGGPWWIQIKVVLIQKGLLDNQNLSFCMGCICWTISTNWDHCVKERGLSHFSA